MNAADGALYAVNYATNWSIRLLATNTSHRGLGTVANLGTNQTSLRLLDSGEIQQLGGSSTIPGATNRAGSESWYALTPGLMTWSNAQAYAQQYGGNLVTIETQAETDWLTNAFPVGDSWIGFYRPQGVYWPDGRWVSGLPSSFVNWAEAEPTYIPGREGCNCRYAVIITRPPYGTWNDVSEEDGTFQGLVELQFDIRTLPEPPATHITNWLGVSLDSGRLRSASATNGSILYAFTDDKNGNGTTDAGDDFVTAEYSVSGTNTNLLTLSRQLIASPTVERSYGLASVNFLNSSNEVFFTGEPDGQVFAWTATGATNPLQRQLFSAHHAGKAWHALAGVKTLEPGEGLVGLRVDPANRSACDVIFWPPQLSLPQPLSSPQTAPITRILPTPNSGKGLAKVGIRIWDGEGNAVLPMLQYSNAMSTAWSNATIVALDGTNYSSSARTAALPTGSEHELVWNAYADLGPAFTNNILLRARAMDVTLLGDWSEAVSYHVETTGDSDGDGLPDAWELAYGLDAFSGLGVNGASGDFDGELFNNWSEFVADTNPRDPDSYLRISSIQPLPGGVRLEWQGGIQATQFLQVRLELGSGVWADIFTNPPPTPQVGTYTNLINTNDVLFYRIRVER